MPKIQVHRKTAAVWASKNPTLSAGEPGYVLGSDTFKVGDGVTPWNDLPFANKTAIQQAINALLSSPTLLGVPKAPHPSAGNRSTQIPTTSWVKNEQDLGDTAVRNELLNHAFPSFTARTDVGETGKLLSLTRDGKVGPVGTQGILDRLETGIVSFGPSTVPTGAVASAVSSDGKRILFAHYNATEQKVVLKGAKYRLTAGNEALVWYSSTNVPVATLPDSTEIEIVYHPTADRWVVAAVNSSNTAFLQLVAFDEPAASEITLVGAAVSDTFTADVPQMFYSAGSDKVVLVYGTEAGSSTYVRAVTVTAAELTVAASGTALTVSDISGHPLRSNRCVVHEPVRDVLIFFTTSDSDPRYGQVKINADGTFTKGATQAMAYPVAFDVSSPWKAPFWGKYIPGVGLVLLWIMVERVYASIGSVTSDTVYNPGDLSWIGINVGVVRPTTNDVQIIHDIAADRFIFYTATSEYLKFATADYYIDSSSGFKQFGNIQHRDVVRSSSGEPNSFLWMEGYYTASTMAYMSSLGQVYGMVTAPAEGIAFNFVHGEINSGKNWLGFSKTTALADEQVRIASAGSIIDLPSHSLDTGTVYYVDVVGNLVPGVGNTVPTGTYGIAGRAIAATKLLVLGNHSPLPEPDPEIPPAYVLPATVVHSPPTDNKKYVRVGDAWEQFNQYDLNAVTTTGACDLKVSNVFKIVNNTATVKTVSFANAPAGRATTVVILIEGNTGAITWPGSGITWSDNLAPELGAAITMVTLLWDGTRYIGSVGAKA